MESFASSSWDTEFAEPIFAPKWKINEVQILTPRESNVD